MAANPPQLAKIRYLGSPVVSVVEQQVTEKELNDLFWLTFCALP